MNAGVVRALSAAICLLMARGPVMAQDQPKRNIRTIVAGKPAAEAKATRLFILSGQSNMGGIDENVSLIPTIAAAFPEDELIFVKRSNSGQPILKWYKGWDTRGDDEAKKGIGQIYTLLMQDVHAAIAEKTLDSVSLIWMQGESDGKQSKGGRSDSYAEALRGLIQQFRDDLKRPDMTVVIGRINAYMAGDAHWDEVRAAQVAVAEADPLADWVDLDDLKGGLHYKPESYVELGKRFAEKTIALLRSSNTRNDGERHE